MPQLRLTGDEVQSAMEDAEKTEMLTVQELEALADKINNVVNIPWVSEDRERVVLFKIVKQIDRALYKVLPNEIYALVKSPHDGISEAEAKQLTDRLAGIINKYIDLPFLSEEAEKKLFATVLGLLGRAFQKGKSLLEG